MRPDIMKDRRNGVAPYDGKEIPHFAPNFTVYVLPSDAVCLYSENRKFFLHGKLYCALAAAIAEGGRSFRALTREREGVFPSEKVKEALKRLIDRRYIIPTSRSSADIMAAYWTSIGLSPEAAGTSLQKCRVGIQSIDVAGATELGAALTRLGVRV